MKNSTFECKLLMNEAFPVSYEGIPNSKMESLVRNIILKIKDGVDFVAGIKKACVNIQDERNIKVSIYQHLKDDVEFRQMTVSGINTYFESKNIGAVCSSMGSKNGCDYMIHYRLGIFESALFKNNK